VIEGLAAKIELLAGRLASLAGHPHVGDIRQRGLMVGLELVADKVTREPLPLKSRTGHRVILAARELGAILRPLGDVIVLMPPLAISLEELGTLCDITIAAIDRGTR
jgi:adenosylmethionine---8-amino-7-oxononanoate aminotransferase